MNWFFSQEGQQAFVDANVEHADPPFEDAHSIHAGVEPHEDAIEEGHVPGYTNLQQYSLQGFESGQAQMERVIEIR